MNVLELIMSQMDNFVQSLDDKNFDEIKQKQLKNYHNSVLGSDWLQDNVRLCIIQEISWLAVEKMKALQKIDKDYFISLFMKDIFPNKYADVLVQGNITGEEARKLFHLIVGNPSLSCTETKITEMKVRRCKSGEHVARLKSLITGSSNSSIINYYQGERATLKTELINEFITMVMEEPTFETLRTKDQLGYNVRCTNRDTYGILGFSISVYFQADKYSHAHVNERIEAFLRTFSKNFRNTSEEEISILKETLKNSRMIVDITLNEEVLRNWGEILDGSCLFDRHQQQLPLIPTITLEEVCAYLQNLISPLDRSSYRKLSIQVMGSPSPNNEMLPCYESTIEKSAEEIMELMSLTEEDLKGGLSKEQFISQLRPFIDQLTFFKSCETDCD